MIINNSRTTLCFDDFPSWATDLDTVLAELVDDATKAKLVEAGPKYCEDARDLILKHAGWKPVIEALLKWISSSKIVAYHGSRLSPVELASIRTEGLLPLSAESRRNRLERSLSSHPKWDQVASKLDKAIDAHGPGKQSGCREQQVHLTLSNVDLRSRLSKYTRYGSEFDRHVAFSLLGKEGMELLATDGLPIIICFEIPGNLALKAANTHGSISERCAKREIPILVNEFLCEWSYRVINGPSVSRASLSGPWLVFREPVPASWIVGAEVLATP